MSCQTSIAIALRQASVTPVGGHFDAEPRQLAMGCRFVYLWPRRSVFFAAMRVVVRLDRGSRTWSWGSVLADDNSAERSPTD